MSLQQHIPEFLRYIRYEKRMSEHSYISYQTDLLQFQQYILEQFGLDASESVRHLHIRSWMAGMKESGRNERTLQRKISTLKSFFKYLMRTGLLTSNPALQVRIPKASKRLPSYLNAEQTERIPHQIEFPEGIEGDTERLILEMLYQTGMRRAELVQLKEQDVEFSRNQLRVLGKRNKERMIPVADTLLLQIRAYIHEKRRLFSDTGDRLLVLASGKPLYPQYVYRVVQKHLKSITTLSKRSPHILRHTFATQLSNNGAELNAIKELLGHSSLAATQVYTHNNIERLKEVYRKAHPKS